MWRWWLLWYLSSEARTDTSKAAGAWHNQHVFTNFHSHCILRVFPLLCCFLRNQATKVIPRCVLAWQAIHQVITPLFSPFFLQILYLSCERPFINTLLIFPVPLLSYTSYLLSRPTPHGTPTKHRKSAIRQASPLLDITFWRKPDKQEISRIKDAAVWGGTCYSVFEEKRDLCDLQPNKGSKWSPVRWECQGLDIRIIWRNETHKERSERRSDSENTGEFSLLHFAFTVALCSRGRIKERDRYWLFVAGPQGLEQSRSNPGARCCLGSRDEENYRSCDNFASVMRSNICLTCFFSSSS